MEGHGLGGGPGRGLVEGAADRMQRRGEKGVPVFGDFQWPNERGRVLDQRRRHDTDVFLNSSGILLTVFADEWQTGIGFPPPSSSLVVASPSSVLPHYLGSGGRGVVGRRARNQRWGRIQEAC